MIPVAIQLGDSNDMYIYMYRNMTIINHWQWIFTLMVINKIDPTVFCYVYCFFHVSPILVQDWVQKSTLKGKLHFVLMIYSDRLHDLPQTNRMVPHMTSRCQSRSGSVNVLKQDGTCYCQNVGCIPLLGDGSIWSSTHWSRDGRTTMPHIYHVLMMAHII